MQPLSGSDTLICNQFFTIIRDTLVMLLNSLNLKQSNVKAGTINLPGSKSISNRVLLISALGFGEIVIKNLLFSDDTKVMLTALKKLGVKIEHNEALKECTIVGCNNSFPNKNCELYVGNAGTAIRPLTACLAFNGGKYKISGTSRMHERPIGDLVASLNNIGAKIEYAQVKEYPPLIINPSVISNQKLSIRGDVSSQFLTSLLIASPILSKKNKLEIQVKGTLISKPYVNITLQLLNFFGLKIFEDKNNNFLIKENQTYSNPKEIYIEGDASSATYFLSAAALSGKLIRVNGVGNKSIQGDIKFIEILTRMGAEIKMGEDWIEVRANKQLIAIDDDFNDIPDAAMTVAILALYAKGKTVIRNIGSWRVKETDRLTAMAVELSKLGAQVTEGEDFLEIESPTELNDATIDTYDDHRMAMCFSLASLNSDFKKGANIVINDPNCVNKTFPNYFKILNTIIE